jgi:hypothetical protein
MKNLAASHEVSTPKTTAKVSAPRSAELNPKRLKGEVLTSEISSSQNRAVNALVDLSVESWRFSRLFSRLLSKLDAGEGTRYVNQYRYFVKRMEESLEAAGLRMVNVEGQAYDPGFAATALNLGDFGPDDVLLVDQMVEPIIMGAEGLVRAGTVMLRKAEL